MIEGTDVDEATEAPLAIRVVGGGTPSAEELAALVVALTPSGPRETAPPTRSSAWQRAAMIEGLGGRPPTSPADLERPWG